MAAPTKNIRTAIFCLLLSCTMFFGLQFSFKSTQEIRKTLYPRTSIHVSMIANSSEAIMQKPEEEEGQQHEGRFQPLDDPIKDESSDESFSACILWMDDNYRLEEWLAYHYYLLKLRYVVLNIDTFSRTSPKAIIDRWNDHENKYNLNMTIVTWKDSDYVEDYDGEMEKIKEANLSSTDRDAKYGHAKTSFHRLRQKAFYKACSAHLVQQNKSWTSFHDNDEFLTFDHWANNTDITASSSRKMEQPGYVLYKLNSIKKRLPPDTHVNETGFSCLVVQRRRYCAMELSTEETNDLFSPSSDSISRSTFPEGFMNISIDSSTDEDRKIVTRRFDTLRYKYLTKGIDGSPKSFIDLSQPNPQLYIRDRWPNNETGGPLRWSPHRAMSGLCNKEEVSRLSKIKRMVKEERFTIGHYLGSFESYSFRDDARQGGIRSYEIWKERSNQTKGEFSHVVRPWLRGFVELVGGPDVASYLLQDAGKFPDDYNVTSRINEFKDTYDFNRGKKKNTRQHKEKKRRKPEK